MILFVVIALSVKTAKFADVNVGLGVLVGVVMCGPVSGANLNPAVTFCNCFKNKISSNGTCCLFITGTVPWSDSRHYLLLTYR